MKKFTLQKQYNDDQEMNGATPEENQSHEESLEENLSPTEILEEKVAELEANNLRLRADIANMQRRTIEETARAGQNGAKRSLEQILPSLDALDLAMQALPEDIAAHPWTEGLLQFEKLLQKGLTNAGLEKMEIIPGETLFDPNLHEAIGNVEASEDYPANTIAQVYQKGYTYQSTVLRSAMVQVAQ